MLSIRLSRVGKSSQPSFRVIVQEHTSSPKGKFLESLGNYQPALATKPVKFNVERIQYWISKGAQPSETVAALLKKEGVDGMEKFIKERTQTKKSKKAPAEEKAAPQAAAPAPVAEAAPAEEAPVVAETPAEAPAEETPAA